MANAGRSSSNPLGVTSETPLERLRRDPYSFSFFAALRQLECADPQRSRVGRSHALSQDVARLGQDCALEFAPSSLMSCRPSRDPATPRIGVAFLGLFGPNGALPTHLSEYALERALRYKDRTFLEFVDLFHQRFLSLFYRAWADAQPTVSHDRPEQDRFAEYVASLCGLGLASLRRRDAMPDLAKLHYIGRLAVGAKNAEGLEAMIGDYFRVGARVLEFIGEWLDIAVRDRCYLGAAPATGTLGSNAIIGARVFECQHRFRIQMGPLDLDRYEQLLPGGGALPALVAIVRNYVGDEYAWEIQLVLKCCEVPALRLGGRVRLGWTTWLGHRTAQSDADDLILDLGNCAFISI